MKHTLNFIYFFIIIAKFDLSIKLKRLHNKFDIYNNFLYLAFANNKKMLTLNA